jgi:hypothetical protein
MKEIFGLAAVVLAIIGHLPYIRDTIWRGTEPHIYTWLVWSIVTTIAFFGQWTTGGGAGSWSTGVTLLLTYGITVLALRYGTKNVTRFDTACLIASFIAIVPWALTNDIVWSVILATLIDAAAYAPTIRKTWLSPSTETLSMYWLGIIRHILAIVALATYSITTALYPFALLIMNIVVVLVIVLRRNKAL